MPPIFFATPADLRAWFAANATMQQELVVGAKREDTRQKRLAPLIDDSAHGRTIAPLTRPSKPN